MEIILKAFNEESFSHQGKHYTIPANVHYRGYDLKEITLVPRPKMPVDVWQPVVSGSRRGLDFMAKRGMKGIIGGTAEQFVWQWSNDYKDANARAGRHLELGEGLARGFSMRMDDSVDAAMRAARPYFEEHVKVAAPLGMLRQSEELVKAVGTRTAQSPASATLENGVATWAWLCGPAEEFISFLKETEEKYSGLEHVLVSNSMGTPREVIKEQLTRFAKEVMPAFGDRDEGLARD